MTFKQDQLAAFQDNINEMGEPITYTPVVGASYKVNAVVNEYIQISEMDAQVVKRMEQGGYSFLFCIPTTASHPAWQDTITTSDGLNWSVVSITKGYGNMYTVLGARDTNTTIGDDAIKGR